ncbi:hypothetical protein M2275_003128 [Rhodococcus opacus]|nr:hypothetical protein [Rhodococcus opacus]
MKVHTACAGGAVTIRGDRDRPSPRPRSRTSALPHPLAEVAGAAHTSTASAGPASLSGHRNTQYHREILALVTFAARWHPFGGAPADEVLINFGMTPEAYQLRLGHLLDYYSADRLQLPHRQHQDMLSMCWHTIHRDDQRHDTTYSATSGCDASSEAAS